MKSILQLLALSFLAPSSWATYQPFPSLVGNNADGEAAVSTGLLPTKAYQMVWNGTTWDRAPELQLGSGVVTATTQRFTLATDGPEVTNSTAIKNNTAGGASAGASLVSSTAASASLVIKASPGTLISLVGYNAKTSAQFIQVHNATALPGDTAVPIYTFTVPASSNFSLDIPLTGSPFTTGIVVCNSSTYATKTLGSADCWFTAVFK